VQTLGKG
jgi:hypothetical protein